MKKKQLVRRNYENFEKAVKFLALNYFLKKVIDIWHGSKYASEFCYFNTDDNTTLPSCESK